MDLDSVDWASLEHAYGTAEDVPSMLRALRSKNAKRRARACDGLLESLDHQGVQRFESTLRAIPFLVALLGDRSTPERGAIARLLAELAVGDTCWFLQDGFHPVRQTENDGCARARSSSVIESEDFVVRAFPEFSSHDMSEDSGLRWIYDAVVEGVPTYLEALADGDADLRRSLCFLFAFLPVRAKTLSTAMSALLDDADASVRSSAALAMSHVTTRAPKSRALCESALAAMRPRSQLEQRCVDLARVRLDAPSETRSRLRAAIALGVPSIERDENFPWVRIDSAPFVFCSTFLGTPREERDEVIEAACTGLPLVSDVDDAADLGVWIAKLTTPERRSAVTALATAKNAWHYTDLADALEARGFPTTRDAMQAK